MGFLERVSKSTFVLHTQIKPNSKNSKKPQILDKVDFLLIFLHSKPIRNKANNELINLLKKKLRLSSNQIKIVSGLKNSRKIIKLTYTESVNEKDIIKKLLN